MKTTWIAALVLALPASSAHADCADVIAALGGRIADATCFRSTDLTTNNPQTTPADNSLPGLPPGAYTPTTDRSVISPPAGSRTPITKAVAGYQIGGRFAADPTGQARFLLRLPDDWNGRVVVAGASGTRSEHNGDFAWSDYVVQKGYAYASQNKGVLNLRITSLSSDTPPDGSSCRLNPTSRIWVSFYDDAADKPFTQWTDYMIAAGRLAKDAVKAAYGRAPVRTYAVGTSNGGYQVRRAVEEAPQVFAGGVDWEGTFIDPDGPNLLIDLPPAIANFPADAPIEAAGYPPNMGGTGPTSFWGLYYQQFWEVTQCQWQKRFDPSWVTYTDGPGDATGTGGYDFYARAAADPSIGAALAEVATTGRIKRPLITVAGTMDALLPIQRNARAYAARVAAARPDTFYRLYEVQNGNHIETYKLLYPVLEYIEPHAQRAFDLLVAHVERGAALPPSQCIPRGGAISADPDQPGQCEHLLAP